LGVGDYTVLWRYRPVPEADCRVEGEGVFDLHVLPRDEAKLEAVYSGLVGRATAAYGRGLSGYRRTNEKELVEYLFECSTDPAAVPYLEKLLDSDSKTLPMLAAQGLARIRNEAAGTALRRYADGERVSPWGRRQIEGWLRGEALPEPWE